MNPIIEQQQRDSEHIKILSVFHYVMGGFAILGMLFLCIHYFIFYTVFSNEELFKDAEGGAPPEGFFDILVWFYLLMGLALLALAIGNILSAGYMRRRKYRTFSFVIAGINCLQVPLGTVLGVFTIIVLMRDTVTQVYEKSGEPNARALQ